MDNVTVENKSFAKEAWETIKVVVQALMIALVLRTFIFSLVVIPTASMVPTLLIGDYLFVSKYAYGYSKHSFPFSAAPFSGRFFGTAPKLGDIAVFKGDDGIDYIKRLVGLPGDEIQVINGVLHRNGVDAKVGNSVDFIETDGNGNQQLVKKSIETLDNGKAHFVLNYGNTRADHTAIFEVPAGHYFMMGDSRDNSNDSRFMDVVKMVPFEAFIGRADFVLLSLANGSSIWQIWNWPLDLRTERLFRSLETIIE